TMSPDYTKTVLYMRMGTLRGELMSTSKIETTLNHVREYLDSKPNPKGYTYYITGGTINFVILAKYINQAQIQGIISGIISIGIIMFLLFRSPETGLVVLVPMVTSIVWIFGFMGWYGIPFGMTEALISPIAIGIGIDDACHILNTLRKKSLEGLPLATAITETHHETGLAIVYTSLANSLGAAVLIFSSFMPVFRSGLLVCAVLIISTLSNLVLFPSVIMFFRIDVCKIREWRLFKLIPINKLLID
ncbi:MAG TPA: MMPL family transporter, partial [Spirochaetota bacterium]|nr:MMPL family transporter [Spirochaetota bacterium]